MIRTILLLLMLCQVGNGLGQDMIYWPNGDSTAVRFSTDPKKENFSIRRYGDPATHGFAFLITHFREDSMRILLPRQVAAIRVRQSSRYLLPGYYVSLPHRLRLFPPTYPNTRYKDNSHGLYRLAYRNADYTLLDRRSHDGPNVEFFLYVMRNSDSTIYELYNKRQINKALRIPKTEHRSAIKSLKNRRDWKGVVRLMQQYARKNRIEQPNNTSHDSQNP
jgi:hypothetical protein